MSVLFATPAYNGLSVGYFKSLIHSREALSSNGIKSDYSFVEGDALIGRARNVLVYGFMQTNFDYLFFVDSDLEWDYDAPLKMVKAKKDLLIGLYPEKKEKESYSVSFDVDENRKAEMIDGILPIKCGAAGFMCLSRNCIETLIAWNKHLKYSENGMECYNLFSCDIIDGQFWGEDTSFINKWRKLGKTAYCMPDLNFKHSGVKKYTGNFMNTVKVEN